ncbi:MAG TPA: tetratricopeptide repeat protein [Pyrinomonadaceae bacterium]|nr:tetratricopeptide repeat protein [Pyrinomonadaceae bacterium]
MTSDPNELKAALQRLIDGNASDADHDAVSSALNAGVLVTGGRAAAIGGNASDVIITTGDQNIVFSFKGADAATVLTALGSIAPTRLHEVPRPPADFTGREDELKELLASIEIGGVTISGLQGMGGIGKTALALKLVELLKPRYPDAQFFLDLKGASTQPLTLIEALAHVVRAYHPAARLPDTESELRGLYLSVLDGQRALLLMDNAANAEQVEPLIPPSSCFLLVTSRQHFTVPGLAAKNLDTLSTEDARDLLLTIAPRIETHADEIAALCGYLPLALRLAAAAIVKYRNLSPADYVRRLEDRQQRLQLIDASLSLSYELLSEELREHWRWLAVFPDTFACYSACDIWEIEVDQAQYILGELMAASLVDWNEANNRYRLHDLARLFAHARLSAEEQIAGQKRFATHFMDVLTAADKLYLEGGNSLLRGLTLFDLEWSNIQAGHAWVAAQSDTIDVDVVPLGMHYPHAGANVLDLRQHSRERIGWLEIALATARRLKNREAEGATLGNLGIAYKNLGEIRRAIRLYEQELLIHRENRNHGGEGNALCSLGLAYTNLDEPHRAIEFFEQALHILRGIGDRRGESAVVGNLGIAYADLGETSRAIQLLEQALLIHREIGDRRGEGSVLGSLGIAYKNIGETGRAIQFFEQALLVHREIGDRKGEGNDLGNLGNAHATLGELRRAISFYEQRLDIAREIGDHRGEGTVHWNLSLVLDQFGERAQAIQHAEQSLVIRDEIEDPRAAQVRAQLAVWRVWNTTNMKSRD